MAYVLVQQATTLGGGLTTMEATFASLQTAGNFNAGLLAASSNTSVVTVVSVADTELNHVGSGTTYAVPSPSLINDGQGGIGAVAYAENIAAAAAGTNVVTCTLSAPNDGGSYDQWTIVEFSGVATSGSLDTSNGVSYSNPGTRIPYSLTLTTGTASDLVLAAAIGDFGAFTVGTVSGTTANLISNAEGQGSLSEYGTSGSPGSVVVTIANTDDAYIFVAAAFSNTPSATFVPLAPNSPLFFGSPF